MPQHRHSETAEGVPGNSNNPTNSLFAEIFSGSGVYAPGSTTPDATMSPNMLSTTGGSLAHNNVQSYLTINFIIALVGLYPSRS